MTVHTPMKSAARNEERTDIKQRQLPLREAYARSADSAYITDHARTCSDETPATEPLYGMVEFGDPDRTRLDISLHKGVGGNSDLPVPGELLCAAIAGCMDSVIRVIANMLGVRLKKLEVRVDADVDLRGTLRAADVPVGFQEIRIAVDIRPESEIPATQLDAIIAGAEMSCVVLQTLRRPPEIRVERVE